MADFFDELGKKITETAEDLGRKAENAVEIQKIKGQIRSLKRANNRDLLEIGRMAYEKFQKGEISDLDCISLCEAIETRSEEIERQEEEIVRIKGVF